jgi:hypothetical protein
MAAVLEREGFSERLLGYVAAVIELVAENDKHFSNLDPSTISYEVGGRYVKIIRHSHGGSHSVHSFVDKSNGDVLKAASWKAPAKHARGNIYAVDFGKSAISAYGANYL